MDGLIARLDDLMNEGVFDMENVDFFAVDQAQSHKTSKKMTKTERIKQKHKKADPKAPLEGRAKTGDTQVASFLQSKLGPEIGECIFSSEPEKLSEEDFEYFVRARKHMFTKLAVVEFLVENNSENQVQKVQIKLGTPTLTQDEELESLRLKCTIPNQVIEAGETGSTFLVLEKSEKTLALDEIQAMLDFEVVILDEDSGEEVNRFAVEDLTEDTRTISSWSRSS